MDGDVKVSPNLTVDEMEWQIDEKLPTVAALGYNAQWPGPRSASPRATSCGSSSRTTCPRRPASTSTAWSSRTSSGRRPVHHPEPIPPGEEYAYDFVAGRPGLAHVPLAPQRDRSGRPRPPGRLRRRSQERPRAERKYDRRVQSGSATTRWRLHDQRPRLPGHRARRRGPGRDGPHPVHERGRR